MDFKDLKVIVPTCDRYLHLVEGLMYTLGKFWNYNSKFIILGFQEPNFKLKSNWEFISLGVDRGPQSWSDSLLPFFRAFKEEYFINLIDDTLMTRPADISKIQRVYAYMLQNREVKKCFLHGSLSDGNLALYGNLVLTPIEELNNEFYDVNQISNYRSSLQSAIWNTEYFLQVLKPGLSPWQFELQHVMNDGVRILTTITDHPTMYSHLYRIGGKVVPEWYKSVYENTMLPSEDIFHIKQMLKL